MALSAYLTLTGTRTGQILGSVTQKGREGSIEVIAVYHWIVSPRDPSSGRPTGKRMHKPLVITKLTDAASPALHDVLTHNENLTQVEIRFFRPNQMGIERHAYTVRLVNSSIASIQLRMNDKRNARHTSLPEVEEVAFAYQRIEWTWTEGGISANDDWEIARM